jgi:hypothetical protein
MRGRFTLVERTAIVALVLAVSTAGAATASAGSPPPRPLAMWHRWSRAHDNAPAFNFFSTVFSFAGPREVKISGVRYEMGLTVFGTPGAGASQPPFASIDLQRSLPRTRPTAFQLHEYDFAPQSGTTFTFNRDTMDTSFDLGAAIAPSRWRRRTRRRRPSRSGGARSSRADTATCASRTARRRTRPSAW